MAVEAGMDIVVGAVMAYGGVPGLIIGGVYYAVEYTIGWDSVFSKILNVYESTSKATSDFYNRSVYEINQPSNWGLPNMNLFGPGY